VPGQSKGRRPVSFKVVTAVASIEVGRCRKLSGVPVAVAVGAALELDLEQRVLAFRNMALRTLETRMLALQGIRGGGMVLHGEQ
jgi:hypothetical protein